MGNKKLKLRESCNVYIDWANVYGWTKFLKKEIGYNLTTKPVKYIPVTKIENQIIYRRKCDFDMEICIDVHKALNKDIKSFIFFTGDGDFEPLYKLLIKNKNQVIVVYTQGHLGREVWNMKKGIFKIELKNLIDLNK